MVIGDEVSGTLALGGTVTHWPKSTRKHEGHSFSTLHPTH